MAMTFVEERYHKVQAIKATWTSAADGTASGTTTAVDWDGQVVMLCTVAGSDCPSDNYDVAVTDGDGVDILCGKGADRDLTNTEYVVADMGAVSCSPLTFSVTNAGDTKGGTIYLRII